LCWKSESIRRAIRTEKLEFIYINNIRPSSFNSFNLLIIYFVFYFVCTENFVHWCVRKRRLKKNYPVAFRTIRVILVREQNGKTVETARFSKRCRNSSSFRQPDMAIRRFWQKLPCRVSARGRTASIAWLPSIDLLFRWALECECKNDLQGNIRAQSCAFVCGFASRTSISYKPM